MKLQRHVLLLLGCTCARLAALSSAFVAPVMGMRKTGIASFASMTVSDSVANGRAVLLDAATTKQPVKTDVVAALEVS